MSNTKVTTHHLTHPDMRFQAKTPGNQSVPFVTPKAIVKNQLPVIAKGAHLYTGGKQKSNVNYPFPSKKK